MLINPLYSLLWCKPHIEGITTSQRYLCNIQRMAEPRLSSRIYSLNGLYSIKVNVDINAYRISW